MFQNRNGAFLKKLNGLIVIKASFAYCRSKYFGRYFKLVDSHKVSPIVKLILTRVDTIGRRAGAFKLPLTYRIPCLHSISTMGRGVVDLNLSIPLYSRGA